MGGLHDMLLEDEILFCGVMLLFGVVVGTVARWITAPRERRKA
jgi:hypothetical protein